MAVPGEQFLVVKVTNIPAVVKKEGGGLAAVATSLMPQMVNTQFYATMRDRLRNDMAKEGVMADVDVMTVPSPFWQRQPTSDLTVGVLLGVSLIGVGLLIWNKV